ncbi:MAG: hypothetical protein ABIQ74_04015 [Chitinophagales bacterium]
MALNYKLIDPFGVLLHNYGDYHPLKFKHPISNSFEVDFGIQTKHFLTSIYFKPYKLRYSLDFTESIDSVSNLSISSTVSDSFKSTNFGLRAGWVASLSPRIQFDITLGINYTHISNSFFQYGTGTLIAVEDSNGILNYNERFFGQAIILLRNHYLGNLELQTEIRYAITKMLSVQATIAYVDNPLRAFSNEPYVYWIDYRFYPLNGTHSLISSGQAYTRFNQIDFGIGISYSF